MPYYYVGRLEKEKGVDKLLEALLLLKNSKVKCLIVGDFLNKTKYGKYWDNIRKMLIKLQGRVFLTGYVPNSDLVNFYAISNFTVIPSQWEEAFGLVALEAMKMKKAVIASDSGGLLEVLSPQGSIRCKKG
ncbi:glycosyltransferase [Limosilactobacillus reuteri]